MNNKGFLFVEAIVTTVMLLAVLVVIYSGYNSSVIEERNRLYYDDVSYIYKAIDISNLLNKNIVDGNNTNLLKDTNKEYDFYKYANKFLINNVYFIKNISNVKNCIRSNNYSNSDCSFIDTTDEEFVKYLSTINPKDNSSNDNNNGIIVITSNQSKNGDFCDDNYLECRKNYGEMQCQCITYYAWSYYYDKEA